jgi:hypothetical protein
LPGKDEDEDEQEQDVTAAAMEREKEWSGWIDGYCAAIMVYVCNVR